MADTAIAPAPTPAPSPTPPPAPAPEPRPSVADSIAGYADTDGNGAPRSQAQPKDYRAPKPAPKAPEPAPAPAPKAAGAPKPADAPKAPTPAPEPAKAPVGDDLPPETEVGRYAPKQLREVYGKAKREIATLRDENAKLKKAPVGDPADIEKFKTQLSEKDKAIADYEQKLRYKDFTESAEYKTSYEKPFIESFAEGRELASQLQGTNESGEPVALTAQHFDRVMQTQSPGEAAKYIDSLGLSPASAQMLIDARSQCRNLQSKAAKAREDFQKNGAELEKTQREQREQTFKASVKSAEASWQKHASEALEKHSDYFKPAEGDDKGNELLKEGFNFAKRAWSQLNPFDPKLTTEQREAVIADHAEMFHKAAGFDRLAYQNESLREKLKAAEEKLAGLAASEPNNGDRNGAPSTAKTGKEADDITSRLGAYADRRANGYVT